MPNWRALAMKAAMAAGRLTGDPLSGFLGLTNGREPYEYYDRIRAKGPLVRSRVVRQVWFSADHATVSTVLRDGRFGKLPPGFDTSGVTLSMLVADPPDHTRLRKLAMMAFTPRAIERLRGQIEEMAHELLDRVSDSGRMDVIADYASVLPIRVICEILGAPIEDREQFRRWGYAAAVALDGDSSTPSAEIERTNSEMRDYFERRFEERRRQPRDDLLQALMEAEQDGDRLSRDELHEMCNLLLIAGFETTVNLIGNGTKALLERPDQLELLYRDPDLTRNAVEEMLRFDSPVQMTSRVVQQEVELAGHRLKPGQQVITLLGGANRDPKAFSDPARLDLRRENAREHLAFAAGIHFCLGAALARLEGDVAFRVLLERCRGLRASGPSPRRDTRLLWGLAKLPVEFEPKPARQRMVASMPPSTG
jgi:cytochrome P450